MSSQPAPAYDIVLASASPRRRDLLGGIGINADVRPVDLDETPQPGEAPTAYVRRVAGEKCRAAAAKMDADTKVAILAADTSVIVDGDILGKAADPQEAKNMLARLAGRRHEVMTSYCIRYAGKEVARTVHTQVTMRMILEVELDAYVQSGEWRDKAGAYAIQGKAALFVSEIRGSLTNVMGLPLTEVIDDLLALKALPSYPPTAFGGS